MLQATHPGKPHERPSSNAPDEPPSPCIGVCVINPQTQLCDAADRTLEGNCRFGDCTPAQKTPCWRVGTANGTNRGRYVLRLTALAAQRFAFGAFLIAAATPLSRQLLHKRVVQCWGYRREDGLWDIEGRLVDTKTYPFPTKIAERFRPVNRYTTWIRLTVDSQCV